MFIIILLLFVLFLVLSLFARLYVTFSYSFQGLNQEINVHVSIFRFSLMNKKLPIPAEKEDKTLFELGNHPDSLGDQLDLWKDYVKQINNMFRRFRIHYLHWSTNVGTGEAASTGIISGLLWGIKSTLVAFITKQMNILQPADISVVPEFERETIKTEIDCLVSMKLADALLALFNMRKLFK